ncbi:MAG: radical SAM protein, partial [Candidatus Izemoplasmatales bacterium]|nr:radical SAM protein [Candidatus Izemoplasmatales bacterium]
MKTLLVSINSKFIHTNTAVRYLKANCDFDVSIKEYTIKDEVSFMLKDILAEKPEIIGFSCYIWNIPLIKEIITKIKAELPETVIIMGGPEVSYEYDDYLWEGLADYIVVNEGEITFNLLISSIINNQEKFNISNLAFLSNGKIFRTKILPIKNLDDLRSPYYFLDDIPYIANKVQYIELSRGCPYQCSYCLASLEKGLRFFNTNYVFSVIDYLVEKGAKTIKFLDRSFNANKKIALDFFKRLVEKDYKDVVFQFEINGDVLSKEIIDFLVDNVKENYVRLELGIQSTNDEV